MNIANRFKKHLRLTLNHFRTIIHFNGVGALHFTKVLKIKYEP